MKKITPCLWFDFHAEEAIEYYGTIFPDLEILSVNRYPEGAPGLAGKVVTLQFRMAGQEFIAINGGPMYKFTEAVSFSIDCKNQGEIDYYWERLTAGGEESMCGWLKDRYGLSWQVVPTELGSLLHSPDPEVARKVMDAMLKMRKLDIGVLKSAAGG
ncbi:MAG TPA: VOC family protein [Bacteroidales bacterium]|nr:VOC family protein [Bacteroidales bacterium]HPS62425.1 VOC family protein [Bacteroidales bacterium]